MTKVFVTGDRSMDPLTAVAVTIAQLNKFAKVKGNGEKIEVYTGDFETGVERAVRYLIGDANVLFHDNDAEGHPDLDKLHKTAAETVDYALMIHGDPLKSRIGKSLAGHFPGDKLILV